MTKSEAQIPQFEHAVQRLEEVLQKEKTDIVRDSAIKRFEFCMDLSWKILKTLLEEEKNVIVHSPNSTFREAYKQGYIEYDDAWITFMQVRNNTVHTYKEILAEETFAILPNVLTHLKQLLQQLKKPTIVK